MDPSSYNQGQSGSQAPQPQAAAGQQPYYAQAQAQGSVPAQPQYAAPTVPQQQSPLQTAPAANVASAEYHLPRSSSAYQQQQAQVQQQQQPAPQATVAGAPASPGTTPVKPATNPNSTQNSLQIAEIRDGIVIMNDGSFRSVIMVKSINFDLMSQQEQEAVEYNYQGFLNSLYFPVQIFIRSQKVDLQPYIEKLDKIRTEHDNMLLALLMDDYIGYIDQLAQQTNIMDKKFYIVVPYFPHVDIQKSLTTSKNFITGLVNLFDKTEQHVVINEDDLEKAKTELRNRVQAVLSGLMQCNIQGLPLDTQELIELYYDTYNPDTATRQQLKNFNQLDADIITKGEGVTVQPHLQRELN